MAQWTKDQQLAINESGKNIIVSAGAGSGKTAVLSERVLEFVKKGYKIDEFLILTFTNLAAGEMKSRIRSKLSEANLSEASNVDTADITTFDSFAFNIVKKYHFMLNLSNKVSIIDTNVMSVKKINIINDLFDELYENSNDDFIKMIDRFCFKDDNTLKDLVLKIHSKAELELDKDNFINSFMDNFYSEDKLNQIVNDAYESIKNSSLLKRWVDSISVLPDVPYKKGGPSILSVQTEAIRGLENCDDYDSLISFINNFSYGKKPSKVLTEDEDKSFIDSRGYHDKLKKQIAKWPVNKQAVFKQINDYKPFVNQLIKIVKKLDKKQYEYKVANQSFEFQDIAKMALKLVSTNTDIQNDLRNKYKMIMIDEYQDTSALQEAFISLIASNNVYMVGDIKQSIYAFRNAKSDIFKDKYLKYKAHINGMAIDMNKNFRSREEVLSDINLIFSDIMSLNMGGADYKKDHVIEYGNIAYKYGLSNTQNYHSTCLLYDADYKKKVDSDVEAKIIANDIKNKIDNHYQVFINEAKDPKAAKTRDIKYSDFCIIMDRGKQFESIKKVFQEYKIPLFIEQDEDIKDNLIVQILKNLLLLTKAIKENDYTSKEFLRAYLSIARSFIFSETDKELYEVSINKSFEGSNVVKTIKEIIDDNLSLSTYELLNKIIERLDIYHKFILIGNVSKNEKYLDEFIKYFKQMSDLDYSIDDFITYLDNVNDYSLKISITSGSTNLDSVRIMNIHKSKGLEFSICYFAGLDLNFNRMDQKTKKGISETYGIYLPTLVKDSDYLVHDLAKIKANNDDLSEKIRLLYVALTRAKEKMIFVMPKYEFDSNTNYFLEDSMSLYDLIKPLSSKFECNMYDPTTITDVSNNIELTKKKIKLIEISFNNNEITTHHASKALKLGSNKKVLERGTMLHEIMEVIDFKNPDLSIINNDSIKEKVTNFLKWDIMKNINEGNIYKEYEFVNDNYSGIIDLLVVYNDHIDIIDYKTKNIDDIHYDEQLHVYKDFISKHYTQEIHMYLYSLLDSNYREVL